MDILKLTDHQRRARQRLLRRHFYNGTHYDVDNQERVIRLRPKFHQQLLSKKLWGSFGYKKIGGTLVGEILECDDYKSQFNAFIRIAWLDMPILDKTYINAGIELEPRLATLLIERTKADIKTLSAADYNYDYFANHDDIIGGVPDAIIPDRKILLEFKTTNARNIRKWEEQGVPASYLKQAQLYTYLLGYRHYSIIALFLEESDYLHPSVTPLDRRYIKSWTYEILEEQLTDELHYIKEWYIKYTNSGISPAWPPNIDKDILDYLNCQDLNQWTELLDLWITEGKVALDTLIS